MNGHRNTHIPHDVTKHRIFELYLSEGFCPVNNHNVQRLNHGA